MPTHVVVWDSRTLPTPKNLKESCCVQPAEHEEKREHQQEPWIGQDKTKGSRMQLQS
jgi:hypothetical protein